MSTQPRDDAGRFCKPPRADALNRYLTDPAHRRAVDATRARRQERTNILIDAERLRCSKSNGGASAVMHQRVIEYARREHDMDLLTMAGIPHDEAVAILAGEALL